jgi:hypothetical protein
VSSPPPKKLMVEVQFSATKCKKAIAGSDPGFDDVPGLRRVAP